VLRQDRVEEEFVGWIQYGCPLGHDLQHLLIPPSRMVHDPG
jgi:hypothetical protein